MISMNYSLVCGWVLAMKVVQVRLKQAHATGHQVDVLHWQWSPDLVCIYVDRVF